MNRKKGEITIRSSAAEYLTYVAAIGDNPESIEVRYEDENIWLTQKMLATLYGVNVATINEHISNIYKDNELEKVNEYYTKNNLLQEKKSNDITKDNIIKLSEFKSNIINNKTDEDKLNESLENYER